MPHVNVQIIDELLTPSTQDELITGITDAVAAAIGEEHRRNIWVSIQGLPRESWGFGGRTAPPLRRD